MTAHDDQGDGFFRRLAEPEPEAGSQRRGIVRWIRRRFMVGLLVVFPLVVTLFFARFIFGLLDRWFLPISERAFGVEIPGIGFMLFIIALFVLGILATNILGGRLLDFIERRIARLPLLSPIYQGARQITEAIQIRGTTEFRKVVLVDFPRVGMRSLGFVTREFPFSTRFCDEPSALVFVPSTPNPTTGFLVVLPQRELDVLDITVEQGVKLLISGGLLTPAQLLRSPADSTTGAEPKKKALPEPEDTASR
jgi:uncharacterized membrane protein